MTPLPDFQQDSYIYFWVASLIGDGIIPFPKFTIDVPVGYPAFIWLTKALFSKTGTIIIVQNLIFVAACIYCLYSFTEYRKAFGLFFIFKYLRSKFMDIDSLFVVTLFLLHLVSVVVVTLGHNRFQTRYVHTTEIFFLLTVLLSIYILMNKKKKLAA